MNIDIKGKKVKVHRHRVNRGNGWYSVRSEENDSLTGGIQEALNVAVFTNGVPIVVERGRETFPVYLEKRDE